MDLAQFLSTFCSIKTRARCALLCAKKNYVPEHFRWLSEDTVFDFDYCRFRVIGPKNIRLISYKCLDPIDKNNIYKVMCTNIIECAAAMDELPITVDVDGCETCAFTMKPGDCIGVLRDGNIQWLFTP